MSRNARVLSFGFSCVNLMLVSSELMKLNKESCWSAFSMTKVSSTYLSYSLGFRPGNVDKACCSNISIYNDVRTC